MLIKKDIKLILHPKKIIITMLIYILIFFSFSYFYNDYMSEKRILDQVTIGLVDQENSLLSDMLVENFKSNKEFSSLFHLIIDEEALLLERYENNELSAIIYIPSDFTESLLHFDNRPLEMILNPNYPLQNTVLKNIMTSYSEYIKAVDIAIYSLYNSMKGEVDGETLTKINEQFSINMVMTALNRNSLFEYVPIETFPSSTSSEYFIFSIIVLVIIFMTVSSSNGLVEEDKQMTLQRYMTCGNSLALFILSKIGAMTLNSVISLVPLFIAIPLIMPFSVIELCLVYLIFILAIFFFSTLSLLIGIYSGKVSTLVSSIFVLILAIIGGQFIPISVMPKFIQDISSFTPNYWIIRSCLYLQQGTLETSYILASILVISSLVLSLLLAKIIRRQYAN